MKLSFFIDHGTFSQGRIQDLLTDTKVCGSYLQQFVGIDEVQSLLQRQDPGRCQTQSFVGAGGTGVGQLLFLADIDLDVLTATGLTDDHTGVYFLAGSDEESTAFLCIVQTVGDRFTGFESDQGTHLTILDISLVGTVVIEYGVQDNVIINNYIKTPYGPTKGSGGLSLADRLTRRKPPLA